ncbi:MULTISPECIES: hypothetical protein [unclassified Leifsonia]|uniref:hypothetical protein n=1 Tax=unclassified Leifsonia TaxID=2663824 RepID=UPI0006F2B5AB|nr:MULTISPECIES: hypothetical protein [unclassified Leifsonia]KQX07102.1 hypothetical protein ASC59_04655 [Leifsonia sp. Root1293]KRA11385.1 hypothetical protein ASD61_04655 [Leifsonia sp. Root60]
MTEESDAAVIAGIRTLLTDAVSRLAAAGARDEALGEYVPAHRKLLVTRRAVMVPRGRVWRLGVLLIDADGALYEEGLTTRAVPPGRTQYQSESAEVRRGYRDAAFRGKFAEGETVNFNAAPIVLEAAELRASTGALFVRDDQPLVRWSAGAGDAAAVPLERYLSDRVDLLVNPPAGA